MTKKDKPRREEKKPRPAADKKKETVDFQAIEADLDKARREATEYLDDLKRLKAEFENFRKRMLREQSDFLARASQRLISELLPVLCDFERALSHADQAGDADFRAGVELVYKRLREVLAKEGLVPIDPLGCEFDPNKHEALMQVESDEHKENTVVEVFEKGYELKGKVIKPAKVKVAR